MPSGVCKGQLVKYLVHPQALPPRPRVEQEGDQMGGFWSQPHTSRTHHQGNDLNLSEECGRCFRAMLRRRARPQVRSGSVVVSLACTDQQDLAESTPTCRRCQWNQGRGLPAGAPENGTGLKRCPNGAACVRSGCKAEHPRTSARNVDSCDAKTGRQPGAVWRVIKRQAVIWRTQQSVAKAATRCVIRITSGKSPPRDS